MEVPPQSLSQLIENLKPGLPRSSMVVEQMIQEVKVCAQNARNGKVKAKFYTDVWPDFTTVVCQIFFPKISEVADIIYYSTSKEKLLHVMKEGSLITWGRPQRLYCMDNKYADYLVENLRPPTVLEGVDEGDQGLVDVADFILFHILGDQELKQQNAICPNGFIVGQLESHHAQYVSEHWWPWYAGKPWVVTLMEALITNYDTSAVFAVDSPTVPISWAMLWPWGCIANAHTVEAYRQKGLSIVVQNDLCKKVLANGDLPGTFMFPDNEPNVRLAIKLGFTEVSRLKMLVHLASRSDFPKPQQLAKNL